MAKRSEKIKVVFELDPDTVRELMARGGKAPDKLTIKQLQEMSQRGEILAGDYLAAEEQAFLGKLISKVATKASTALKSDKANKKASDLAQDMLPYIVIDNVVSGRMEDIDLTPKS